MTKLHFKLVEQRELRPESTLVAGPPRAQIAPVSDREVGDTGPCAQRSPVKCVISSFVAQIRRFQGRKQWGAFPSYLPYVNICASAAQSTFVTQMSEIIESYSWFNYFYY